MVDKCLLGPSQIKKVINGNNPCPVRAERVLSRKNWQRSVDLFNKILLDEPAKLKSVSGPAYLLPWQGMLLCAA